jgi:hypothetical protein
LNFKKPKKEKKKRSCRKRNRPGGCVVGRGPSGKLFFVFSYYVYFFLCVYIFLFLKTQNVYKSVFLIRKVLEYFFQKKVTTFFSRFEQFFLD